MNISNDFCPRDIEYYGHKLCSADLYYDQTEGSDSFNKDKVFCHNMSFSGANISQVTLMNSTQLFKHLNSHTSGMCAIVLFYAVWCPFSMQMAVSYNAFGRIFSGIPVLALEVQSQFSGLSSNHYEFGAISVPSLLIFHRTMPISRYNKSATDLNSLIEYVGAFIELSNHSHDHLDGEQTNNLSPANITGGPYYIIDADYEGPLPTKYVESPDWLLLFSTLFLLFVIYTKLKSKIFN